MLPIPPAADSFRDYVHARGAALARTAMLLTGDSHLAQDLVQQTLIDVASKWAPDSRTAVGVILPDGGGTSYGPDGEPLDGPDDEVVLVDVASGAVRTIATVPDASLWRAAFSPDGGRLAIHAPEFEPAPEFEKDSALTIVDTRTGNPSRTVPLTERQRLAGPAAWTPDGAQLLLAAIDGCGDAFSCAGQIWHLRRLDVATGTISDETARGRPGDPTLVAWRDGEPVVQQAHDDGSCDTVALTATGARTLPLTAAGYGCADYARDLLEEGTLGGPRIEPSPWEAQWWANALVAGLLAGLVLIVRRIRRRGRGSTRADATPPASPHSGPFP